jgi:hypothetical protein
VIETDVRIFRSSSTSAMVAMKLILVLLSVPANTHGGATFLRQYRVQFRPNQQ